MLTSRVKLTLMFLFLVIFSAESFAQPPGRGGRANEQIRQIKSLKLLEILDLDEETYEKFLAKQTYWEKQIADQMKRVDDVAYELEVMIRTEKSDKDIQKKIDEFLKVQDEFFDMQKKKIESMREILEPREYAKYIVFEQKFPREMHKILFRRFQENEGRRRGQGGGWDDEPPE